MRNWLILTILASSLLLLSSCKTSEERALNRLEKLSEKIEKYGNQWDADDWADAFEEIQDIHYDLQDCDLNKAQAEELGRIEARLTATIITRGARAMQISAPKFLENGASFLYGFNSESYELYDEASFLELHTELEELKQSLSF